MVRRGTLQTLIAAAVRCSAAFGEYPLHPVVDELNRSAHHHLRSQHHETLIWRLSRQIIPFRRHVGNQPSHPLLGPALGVNDVVVVGVDQLPGVVRDEEQVVAPWAAINSRSPPKG